MAFTYVPDAGDAAFGDFSGQAFDDPAAYAAANNKRIDAKFFLKPVQDEVLNLIALALAGGSALKVRNETGATLAKGALLYASGYSSGQARFLAGKADAADAGKPAWLVLDASLNSNANGLAYPFRDVSGIDTSGASAVGAAVFLSTTAGAFGFSAPAGAGQAAQQVGVVTAKDASAGAIRFFPGARLMRAAGTPWIQDAGVTAAKLADAVADKIADLSISIGAETSDQIDATIQMKDAQGNNLSAISTLEFWLADSATGWESSTAADALSVTTGTAADVPTAAKRVRALTNGSGQAAIRIAKTGAQTWYGRVLCGGFVYTSAQITFT